MRWALYVIALAVLVTRLQWVGVPALTLLIAGLASVCLFIILLALMTGGLDEGPNAAPS